MPVPTETALDWYAREWSLIPAMPTAAMADAAEGRLHARVEAIFGQEAAKAAWQQFCQNKRWPDDFERPAAEVHVGRHTKRVRAVSEDELSVTLGGTEFVMPFAEANELIGLIRRARQHRTKGQAPSSTAEADEPEAVIVVSQMIRGNRVQAVKRLDLLARARARFGIADAAIDEALGELSYYRQA